jgi:hypothetical protein
MRLMPKAGKYKWLPPRKRSPTLGKLKLKNCSKKKTKKKTQKGYKRKQSDL